MRYLEKVTIGAIMVMVIIYTVNVGLNFPYSNTRNVPISKQEAPASQPVVKKEASFFPEIDLNLEDESIIEETFTEHP